MRHTASFDIPTCELGKSDIHVTVKANRKILGKLEISKGALVWYPADTTIGHKISWEKFDEEMRQYPKRERRKAP